jgi:hypothetical protein
MKKGGAVRKRRAGGPLSPTTEKRDQRSPGETMPAERLRHGGGVKKRQLGGLGGGPTPAMMSTLPAQRGQPNISGRMARPALPNVAAPMPNMIAQRFQPAPGTSVGFKKGGKTKKHARGGHVHADEAEDKKLFERMYKKEEAKEKPEKRQAGGAVGGFTPTRQESDDPGLAGTMYHQQGAGFRRGGYVEDRGMGPHMPGSAAGGLGRLEKTKMAAKVPAKTES